MLKKKLLFIGGLLAVGLLAVGIGYAAIRGGDKDEAANGNGGSGARDVDRFLMRNGEQPGFRPDGDAFTVVGVNAIAESLATGARRRAATARTEGSSRSRRGEPLVVTGRQASTRCCCSEPPRGLGTRWRTTCARARSTRPCPRRRSAALRCATFRVRAAKRGATCTVTPLAPCIGYRVAARPRLVSEGDLPFVEVLSTGARADPRTHLGRMSQTVASVRHAAGHRSFRRANS